MSDKNLFASKLGLIAATVGSAVGLGNVWRFPAETQANGGAAFLLVYILCVLILGVPVMVAEFAIGRGGRSDAVGSFKNLGAKKGWWAVGGLAIFASYVILCFYMVVAGWTLEYMINSITGTLYEPVANVSGDHATFVAHMNDYIVTGSGPVINTFIMIVINLGVLLIGVQKGIERMSNMLMPLLFVILLILCGVSLTLPGASKGLKFFLAPDFSALNGNVIINALGQAFFSLSLGMGILITYSSYFPDSTKLTRTAVTVSLLDLLVAILMGFVIFPAVMTFGLEGENLSGATLVFVTLPEVFVRMPFTQLWSVLFFLLLTVAALTSTISISEVSVAFFRDRLHISRTKACLLVILPLFVFSTICCLSQGPLSYIQIMGKNIFDFLDTFATNLLLPIVAIGLCIYVGWFAPKNLLLDQMTNDGSMRSRMFRTMFLIIRYPAPILIAIVLVSAFI